MSRSRKKEVKEEKGQVVRNDLIFKGDIFKILFPFICDRKELPKLKILCKGIKIHVEYHISSFLNTNQIKIDRCFSYFYQKRENRKDLHYKNEEIFDFFGQINFMEVLELNLMELNSFLSLLDKESEKPLSLSKRFKDLFKGRRTEVDGQLNTYSWILATIEWVPSVLMIAPIISAVVALPVVSASATLSFICMLSFLVFMIFLLPVALYITNYLVLGSIYTAATSQRQDKEVFGKSNISTCSKDILSALSKIKNNDFLVGKYNKKASGLKLDTIEEVIGFVKNRINFFEKEKLEIKQNKNSVNNFSNLGDRNNEKTRHS